MSVVGEGQLAVPEDEANKERGVVHLQQQQNMHDSWTMAYCARASPKCAVRAGTALHGTRRRPAWRREGGTGFAMQCAGLRAYGPHLRLSEVFSEV